MNSLETSDDTAAAVQQTPNRVTLDSIREKIADIEYHNPTFAPHMTVAFLKMDNGYVVIGTSAPADPGNFDVNVGRQFAYEDAVRKIWPLEGYALCDRLAEEGGA